MSETIEIEKVIEKEKQAIKPPTMWNVIMVNDDYTTMEFVIACLCHIFNKTEAQAVEITLNIHKTGKAVVGTYIKDIALTKQHEAMDFAKHEGHPLQVLTEPV